MWDFTVYDILHCDHVSNKDQLWICCTNTLQFSLCRRIEEYLCYTTCYILTMKMQKKMPIHNSAQTGLTVKLQEGLLHLPLFPHPVAAGPRPSRQTTWIISLCSAVLKANPKPT